MIRARLPLVLLTLSLALSAHPGQVRGLPTPRAELERRQQVNRDGSPAGFQRDFVEDAEQFQAVLEHLKSSSVSNPWNYVSDEVSAEEIMRTILGQEQAQMTTGYPELERAETTTSSDVVAREVQPTGLVQEPEPELELEPGTEPPTEPAPEAAIESLVDADVETTTHRIVTSEEEFESILEQLGAEALDSLEHPMNYVNDEAQLQLLAETLSEDPDPDTLIKRWRANKPLVGEDLSCPICREDMDLEDEAELPCRHTFHRPCLISWFRGLGWRGNSQVSCPVCRRETRFRAH